MFLLFDIFFVILFMHHVSAIIQFSKNEITLHIHGKYITAILFYVPDKLLIEDDL
jgi:hypothetical protein